MNNDIRFSFHKHMDDYKLESSRIELATEPYPNRWTHHLLLSDTKEMDDEISLFPDLIYGISHSNTFSA